MSAANLSTTLFLNGLSLAGVAGAGLAKGETGQAEPDWPAPADWLQNRLLPKAALRPGLFLPSLASTDAPQCIASADALRRLASSLLFFFAPRACNCSSQRTKAVFSLIILTPLTFRLIFFPSHESRVFDYSGYQSREDLKKLYVCPAPIEFAAKPFQSDETDGPMPRRNRNDDK